MRRWLRHQIPSMFHRRLLLLLVGALAVVVVMAAQTARLTVGAGHEQAVDTVYAALQEAELVPTVRGRILDRYGLVLAEDESSYDVTVSYSVIVGDWAYNQGLRAAQQANRQQWAELDPTERQDLAEQHREVYDEQIDQLWRMLASIGGVDRAELERRRNTIHRSVHQEKSYLSARWLEQKRAELGDDITFAEAVQPIAAERQAHAMLFDVPPDVSNTIERFVAEAGRDEGLAIWRQVQVHRSKHRRYPLERIALEFDRSTLPNALREDAVVQRTVEGVAVHTLGTMRPAWAAEFEHRPYRRDDLGGYLDGDQVGAFGIERAMEHVLRGVRGRVVRRRDTGAERRREPAPGRDVRLTLDARLQARIQGVMSPDYGLLRVQEWHGSLDEDDGPESGKPQIGDALNAAAIVLEVHSAEVLAAVTTPGYTRRELDEDSRSVWHDRVEYRYLNRPIARTYAPGSTLKPMVLAAAIADRRVGVSETIECRGHYYPNRPNSFRCWIHGFGRQHGHLDGAQALQHSCNIYFYSLGDRLGPQGHADWLRRFGLGARTASGLREESAGHVPTATDMSGADHIFLGIGQGPVNWTVLQAAAAYAALGRGGTYLTPTFVADPTDAMPRREPVALGLSTAAQRLILDGLDRAANEPGGTAYRLPGNEPMFTVPGLRVLGKSGTAQVGGTRQEWPDGQVSVRRGDHAWMIVLVRPDGEARPTHVVAVVVEHGGSGGRVAGPVVNQILHAMKMEGYF